MSRLLALLFALAVALAGCASDGAAPAGGDDPSPTGLAESDAPLTAAASVFPLAWMTERVAPGVELTFLGGGGAEVHDVELSPGDRQALETADVVVHLGDIDFQPQIEQAAAASTGEVVSVAETVGEGALRSGAAHTDEEETHADDDEPADDDGHADVDGLDPHVWFDPSLMAEVATSIGTAFASADPANAVAYDANAAGLAEELTALDGEIDSLLADCEFSEAIVSHEAYAYLLEPRDLEQHGIAGQDPDAGVSPAELAALTEEIQAEGIPAVLAEPIEGRGDAEALAGEAGVDLLEIDPLESVTHEQYEAGYPAMLREQAEAFATALGCGGS